MFIKFKLSIISSATIVACSLNANAALLIDWVTVGDAGNAADTTGRPNPVGAVADEFQIMKYEFTNQLYTEFLNAVDPNGTNPNRIYNELMGSTERGGISFNPKTEVG